jgi:hypothetical protein
MEQKFLITDNDYDVNSWLNKGWRVVSVTAQHVSAGSYEVKGKFAIVLEKEENK